MEKKFRRISLIFLIGCILVYSIRFVYYYKKFNKKSSNNKEGEVLALTIQKDNGLVSEGEGLYNNEGELVFRGKNVNNYLVYSNILWRIVKVNTDNSILLITDSTISNLFYSNDSSDYLKSDIYNWLNKSKTNTGIFENILSNKKKYLVPNTLCLDTLTNLNNITCHKKDNENYVGLLSVADYLNSKDKDSYINNTDSIWTINGKDSKTAWIINKGNLSNDSVTNIHGVKAVVTLNNTIGKIDGDGTVNNPYTIEKESDKIEYNSYVKFDKDLYTVIDINDKNIKLANVNLINDQKARYYKYYNENFDLSLKTSLAYYLNNTYYNTLSYKNNLVDCDYYVGDYEKSYKDIYSKKITAKIGLLSIADINSNDILTNYLLLNKYNNVVFSVNDQTQTYANKIRTTICIDKKSKLKGNGTKKNPFELEA